MDTGLAYADLVEADTGSICVMATLRYIFERLGDPNTPYECVNASRDGWGGFQVDIP